jgi:hypothetical protein
MLNEGDLIHNFISSSGSGTVINYGSGSDFLTSYGSGSGSSSTRRSYGSYGSGSTTLDLMNFIIAFFFFSLKFFFLSTFSYLPSWRTIWRTIRYMSPLCPRRCEPRAKPSNATAPFWPVSPASFAPCCSTTCARRRRGKSTWPTWRRWRCAPCSPTATGGGWGRPPYPPWRPSCSRQGWKKPGFFWKKNQPSGFFIVFFWFFGFFLYICPEVRVFRVSSVSRILLGASRR